MPNPRSTDRSQPLEIGLSNIQDQLRWFTREFEGDVFIFLIARDLFWSFGFKAATGTVLNFRQACWNEWSFGFHRGRSCWKEAF